ncbi:NUDIX domain-containing protein [Streptomyces rapamycinicus]|uniref:Nudix hydrolase domain-containing protein n=1 Tax=Streptomyces rapamycinicus TaxID=1226757 RepID=A0ABR6LRW2_9ACTN|nr:NUDIX domain-containing protein [Streptomyces rapamycinicus]MBB4785078.1 hypothetical protein [Streptomyces rapamycinicus]
MTITADQIRAVIGDYISAHPEEKTTLAPVLDLLDSGADLTSRKEFRGHATAGAVLIDDDGQALFIEHLALGKWLLPGGHLEADDADLMGAALRELARRPASVLVSPRSPPSRCTSTYTPSRPTTPRASPTTSTSTSATCSAPLLAAT